MNPERTDDEDGDVLSDDRAEKDAQVLRREPLETELMDHDESAAGEEIDGVEATP